MDSKSVSDIIDLLKKNQRETCQMDRKSYERGLSPLNLNTMKDPDKKAQCALLDMKSPSYINYSKRVGGGVQGQVYQFTMTPDPTGEDIKNKYFSELNQYIGNLIIKSGINEKNPINSTDDRRTEAFIGLYINILRDLTPNFTYSHDVRLLRNPPPQINFSKIMLDSYRNVYETPAEYGIITEFSGNITFKKFLEESMNDAEKMIKIPDLLKQILFSLYIGVTEIGFVHFDLHLENILLKETREETIDYMIPMDPKTFQQVYGNLKNQSKWDLRENVWILSEKEFKRDSETNLRVPLYQNIHRSNVKLSEENSRIPFQRRSDGKYIQRYRYISEQVKTHGFVAKIIDFGFSSIYISDEIIINKNATKDTFSYFNYEPDVRSIPRPDSYLAFDMWRLLIHFYFILNKNSIKSLFTNKVLANIFGEEYLEHVRKRFNTQVAFFNDLNRINLDRHNRRLEYQDAKFVRVEFSQETPRFTELSMKVMGELKSTKLAFTDISRLRYFNMIPNVADNEMFMNKCLVEIHKMLVIPKARAGVEEARAGVEEARAGAGVVEEARAGLSAKELKQIISSKV